MKNFRAKLFWKMKSMLSAVPLLVVLVLAGCFLAQPAAAADWVSSSVYSVIGYVATAAVWFIGKLLVLVVDALIAVAQYNGFVQAQPVREGWLILRDLSNMFFILILLIIAFATVLQVKKYSFSNLFVSVIIAAIFINFSKLICALIIDFAQVIMLTFVAGFQEIGGGNFTALLGINELMALNTSAGFDSQGLELVGAYILAVIYALVSLVVMLGMLVMLVSRIVFLWIYVIMSPIAWLMSAFPGGGGYSGMWWKNFTSNVVVGPVLAFFIWLSVATLGSFKVDPEAEFKEKIGLVAKSQQEVNFAQPVVGVTKAGTTDHLIRLAISLAFLMGGVTVAQRTGGAAGVGLKWANDRIKNGSGWMKKKASRGLQRTANYTKETAKSAAQAAGRASLGLAKTADAYVTRKVTGEPDRIGFAAQAIGFAKDNTPKKLFDKISMGGMANSALRYNATQTGKAVVNGITYKKRDDDGTFESADGRKLLDSKGRPVKAMGEAAKAFHENYYGSKAVREKFDEKSSAKNKEIDSLKSKVKNFSQAEIKGLARTALTDIERQAYVMAAYEKDPVNDPDFLRFAEKVIAKNPNLSKGFRDLRLKNESFAGLFDATSNDQIESFKEAAKKGDIKLSEQKINSKSDAGKIAEMLPHYIEAVGWEKFRGEITKIDKEDSKEKSAKIAESLNAAAAASLQKTFNRLFEQTRQTMRQSDPTLSLADIDSRLNNDAATLAKLRSQAVVEDKEGFRMRSEQVKLTGKLDAFKYNGQMLDGSLARFWQTASAASKLGVDADDPIFNDRSGPNGSNKYENMLVSGMSVEQLKQMSRKSEDNPELVEKLAHLMAKNNHPDTEKLTLNVNTSVKVDKDAVEKNGLIRTVLQQADFSTVQANNSHDSRLSQLSANDVKLQNDIREALENQSATLQQANQRMAANLSQLSGVVKASEQAVKQTTELLDQHKKNLNQLNDQMNQTTDRAVRDQIQTMMNNLSGQIATEENELTQRRQKLNQDKAALDQLAKQQVEEVDFFKTKDGKLTKEAKKAIKEFIATHRAETKVPDEVTFR